MPKMARHVGANRERVTLMCAREVQTLACHQIVTKTGAKGTKMGQIQKTEIVAILRGPTGYGEYGDLRSGGNSRKR